MGESDGECRERNGAKERTEIRKGRERRKKGGNYCEGRMQVTERRSGENVKKARESEKSEGREERRQGNLALTR